MLINTSKCHKLRISLYFVPQCPIHGLLIPLMHFIMLLSLINKDNVHQNKCTQRV